MDFKFTKLGLKAKDELQGADVTSWNSGKYLIYKVLQKPRDQNSIGFKIYSVEEEKEIVYFLRKDHEDFTGFISEIKSHPEDDKILLFVIRNEENFNVVEVNITNLLPDYEENKNKLKKAIKETSKSDSAISNMI